MTFEITMKIFLVRVRLIFISKGYLLL